MTKALQTMEWMTPGSNLNAYIQGASAIPILSVDEEKSLGESLFYNEDLDAARKLVLVHLRSLYKNFLLYSCRNESLDFVKRSNHHHNY